MGVWYATRESVKSRLDVRETARANSIIDDAIETGARETEQHLHRRFYPLTATRYFPWPDAGYPTPWRLWLDEQELISATTVTSGGTEILSSDYLLEPVNAGPPYGSIEINLSTSAALSSGDTHQRAFSIAGVWGYWDTWRLATTLAEALDSSETGVDVATVGSALGVGSILKVDNERMLVTERAMLDTTVNTGGALTAATSDVSLAVASGAAFSVGEVILVDSERMLIVDIAGNTLTLKRAWDGSVLASHSSGADIYAPRTLTVERGALGTTAAAHSTAAEVSVFVVPSGVATLNRAIATNIVLSEHSGWSRTVGSGENEREASGAGLAKLIKSTRAAWGRRARGPWAV